MHEFALINGKVVSSTAIVEADVLVKDGKILKVGAGLGANFEGKKYDLNGKYILPGLIDAHVHFRTPGNPEKEDWETGSKAALAGGVTTVLDMPNTNPATTDAALLEAKRDLVKGKAMVNYGFYLGATKSNLQDLKGVRGAAGVKVYMGSSTGNLLVDDAETLENLMRDSGHLLALHAESEACIRGHIASERGHEEAAIHSKIRAPECAVEAVKLALSLVEKYPQARVHFCHVSTAAELQLIREFKKSHAGVRVSVEVTPHHLYLSEEDYGTYGNVVKVNPPLRSKADVAALWQGIADSTVDLVATDHAPHLMEEKMLPYDKAPSGVPGVQTMLPLLLQAVHEGKLSLERVVELTAENPAKIFGIQNKGRVAEGFDADLAIVDFEMVERICHKFLWTKADWSPFHGWHLQGWPVMSFVGGDLMYQWRDGFGKTNNSVHEVEFISDPAR